jgi:hypothetical protein
MQALPIGLPDSSVISQKTLRRWRLAFAHHLREQNIAANATERVVRGQIRESKPKAIYHTERDAMPPPRTGREQIACERSAKVLDGWVENTALVSR